MAGFTTVRDLGDDGVIVRSLKNAIDRGWVVGHDATILIRSDDGI